MEYGDENGTCSGSSVPVREYGKKTLVLLPQTSVPRLNPVKRIEFFGFRGFRAVSKIHTAPRSGTVGDYTINEGQQRSQ